VKKPKQKPPSATPATHALTISNSPGTTLNKDQQLFNRLVQRIEQLREQAQKVLKKLDEQLAYYGKTIHPLQAKLIVFRKELVLVCYPHFLAKKGLSKSEKQTLRHFLINQIDEIRSFEETPDPVIEDIFRELTGMSFEEADNDDFEEMKAGFEDLFGSMGFDVDLDDFDKNMSNEERERKINKLQEDLEQSISEKKNGTGKPKTKKQLQQEEKERMLAEARNKNIGTIYKQLAKLFHPDLEADENRKPEKEELMKQLTSAYDNNDLHTLLKLELEYIYKEESARSSLTGQKLKLYNQVLKEQVAELEDEIRMIELHPRYAPIQPRNAFGGQTLNLKKEKLHLENMLRSMETGVRQLKGSRALAELKTVLYVFETRD